MLSGKEDIPITWDIQFCDPPTVLRYCKKCGKKSEYICSGEFCVNAQQKTLIVMDLQESMCGSSGIYPHKEDFVERVNKIILAAKQQNEQVIYICQEFHHFDCIILLPCLWRPSFTWHKERVSLLKFRNYRRFDIYKASAGCVYLKTICGIPSDKPNKRNFYCWFGRFCLCLQNSDRSDESGIHCFSYSRWYNWEKCKHHE